MPNDSKRWTPASREIESQNARDKNLSALGNAARKLKRSRSMKHEALAAALCLLTPSRHVS